MKKDLTHPIFLACCQYCKDSFWKNIFEELAYGNWPYGSHFNKNIVYINRRSRKSSYKCDITKDALNIYKSLYNIFSTKLKLSSVEEKLQRAESLKNSYTPSFDDATTISNVSSNGSDTDTSTTTTISNGSSTNGSSGKGEVTSFSVIKKKNCKDTLVENFIVKEKRKWNISDEDAKKLLASINLALLFRTLSSKNISYSRGEISHIEGIEFYEGGYTIEEGFLG